MIYNCDLFNYRGVVNLGRALSYFVVAKFDITSVSLFISSFY